MVLQIRFLPYKILFPAYCKHHNLSFFKEKFNTNIVKYNTDAPETNDYAYQSLECLVLNRHGDYLIKSIVYLQRSP